MSLSDPIGDMIARLKNSQNRNHKKIELEYEEMTLREAWNCKKLKDIRYLHENNRRCEIKPGCQNCRHGMKKKGVTIAPTFLIKKTHFLCLF